MKNNNNTWWIISKRSKVTYRILYHNDVLSRHINIFLDIFLDIIQWRDSKTDRLGLTGCVIFKQMLNCDTKICGDHAFFFLEWSLGCSFFVFSQNEFEEIWKQYVSGNSRQYNDCLKFPPKCTQFPLYNFLKARIHPIYERYTTCNSTGLWRHTTKRPYFGVLFQNDEERKDWIAGNECGGV